MKFEDFNFELKKVAAEIKKKKAKTVLIQLPDGLKPFATKIEEELTKTKAAIFIWAGSCYGACDLPKTDFDLTVQFGHNKFK